MENKKNARCAEDLENQQHTERVNNGLEAASDDSSATPAAVSSEDEEALRLAREWRAGRQDAWLWLAGRLVEAQQAGRHYESFRRLTDELSQAHDFADDDGRGKVTVPHRRGLGRGLALLMIQEHPAFGSLFRMRGASDDVR
jgi:hypothetical protein